MACMTYYEAVWLARRAHVRDVRKHPRLDPELHSSSDNGSYDLGPEHLAGVDLHVVSKLEVRRERQRLGYRDVTPRFEHHHGDRAAR